MFIRLFIKTIDKDKVIEIVRKLLSYINEDNIKYKDINIEPYWKYDGVTVSEIKLELYRPFCGNDREDFLNSISNKWIYFGEEEVLSSDNMDNCRLNYNLEMVNIFFS
ncbi:hypothetical protein [Paenibacillus sp.]|jgi:hypothetical protein|uniref:hypothetical protein n=1 Tax=Paenibacillus sp. TaxID=58172 RepID=UPI002823AEF5|nr:hypothetical protein [Paenibacillus sp.]MDR0267188.1 hypothetical protein [Paenibacillus sp.]